MDFELWVKITVLVVLIGFFVARGQFTRHYTKRTPRTLIKYVIFIALMGFYFAGSFDFALLSFTKSVRIGLGLPLTALGLILFFWAHVHLGTNWSPVIEKKFAPTRKLVTTGPYQYVRHPTYLASFIVLAGLFMFSANWLLAGIPFVLLIVFYSIKIPREERELLRNFGTRYKNYRKRTL